MGKMSVNYAVDPHDLVMEFHDTYGMPIGEEPHLLPVDRLKLRMSLIAEEYTELQEALEADDLIEVVDALGDLVYVIYGMAIEMGVNLSPVMSEIQRSNMSKLDENGKVIMREDGKILKGPYFQTPNIADALGL